VPPARHRAGGSGRPIAFRTAAPRHAAPTRRRALPLPEAARPALLAGAGLAIVLGPVAGAIVAIAVNVDRHGAVVPPLLIPAPAPAHGAPPAFVPPEGVPRAMAVRFPVLLGRLTGDRLAAYCRTRYGPAITAALIDDGWTCWPPDTGRGLIDMDAACRWRYGEAGWAGMTNDDNPDTWRCYRDPA
jgi:hypothetical protein